MSEEKVTMTGDINGATAIMSLRMHLVDLENLMVSGKIGEAREYLTRWIESNDLKCVDEMVIKHEDSEVERLTKAIVIQCEQDEGVRKFGSDKATVEFFTNRYTEANFS